VARTHVDRAGDRPTDLTLHFRRQLVRVAQKLDVAGLVRTPDADGGERLRLVVAGDQRTTMPVTRTGWLGVAALAASRRQRQTTWPARV
jgi:hypothetical protein